MKAFVKPLSLTKRILLGLSLAGCITAGLIYPQTAAAVGLNHNSVITDKTIKAGDVFTGLNEKADKVIGPAPLPGQDMVLNARTLLRIAMALDLPWRPETSMEQVVLTSAATVIDEETIESAIRGALEEKGIKGRYTITLDGEGHSMTLPHGTSPVVEVVAMDVKPEANWFEARLVAPSKDRPLSTAKVVGRIQRMTEVPVLRSGLNNGDIIGARDIEMMEIPDRSLNGDIILKAEDLIGMTPRRVVVAAQPIQFNQIESPRMVARGDIVTMIFKEGPLQLTAQGKALENGARGDKIRVVNVSSSKTILAEVSNTKEVTLTQ